MTWFKVDDSFPEHPKAFDAPDCAVALWTRAGAWAARNLTDGFVPSGMPARLCEDPERAVRELIDRGLWRRAKGGYQFHDWADYQPMKDKVIHSRQQTAARQQAWRDRKKTSSSGPVPSREERRVNNAASNGVINAAPTRPDPPPKGGEGRGVAADISPAGRCTKHRGQPAGNCGICRSEAIAAREDEA